MIDDKYISSIIKGLRKSMGDPRRPPVSVYRLQFNQSFTFSDATRLLPYLHELGVTDCYASPYLKARVGSQHGYDISDHNMLNPEIGSEEEYKNFVRQLHKLSMGQILDFVPNHMGIFDNPKWQDVLENGPSSLYARFFDIDWEPLKTELHQRVLLPILEDLYGKVLEGEYLSLAFDQGTFIVKYRNHQLPIDPKTTIIVLEPCLERLQEILGTEHGDFLELQSIITACKNLPARSATMPEKVAERQREKEIIKRRLAELYARNEIIKTAIDESIRTFRGAAGDSSSFNRLNDLLEQQAYRLSYWRVAADEVNYRRFFNINELVALRMEDPLVFEEAHRLVRKLLAEGALTGIRIDHVDGLFDPADYLWRLQRAHWLDLALREAEQKGIFCLNETAIEEELMKEFERERGSSPGSPFVRPLYVVVEKILGDKETLRETWPVDGTTGYEFMIALNGMFVPQKHRRAILDTYRWFTGASVSFQDILYQCKNLVMRTSMTAEVNLLAHQLNRVSERSWQYRDFTLNSLGNAIREVIACFPVYRTYINSYEESIDERDKAIINNAVLKAKRRNPAVSSAIFDFVKNALLLQHPTGMSEEGRNEQRLFVMRFQQFTGPVMAKGMEDTAFYIYNPLVSLNEVGGNPDHFGMSVEDFHRQNVRRQQAAPHSLVCTSTHDSKRGEDVRARINVLSEMPKEWRAALRRWSHLNENRRIGTNGDLLPDRNEEYLLYQTLLGTYPQQKMSRREATGYICRIQQYLLKALREAKVHTSWISPNTSYEEGVARFIKDILEPSTSSEFLADFEAFNKLVATCGMYNSLSQTVLKLFSPGVPHIYQGNELWAFNLTDPDNRRKVDFGQRARLLERLKEKAVNNSSARLATNLMKRITDGQIKLYITWKALNFRRDNATLFSEGSYTPLRVAGMKRNHLCAFAWRKGEKELIVVAPRLIAELTQHTMAPPMGTELWGDTHLTLPRKIKNARYRDIFTGKTVPREKNGVLSIGMVLSDLPVAALERLID